MIYLGSDHAGFPLKQRLVEYLKRSEIPYTDMGTHSEESADYPDYAFSVATSVAASREKIQDDYGILICGSGIGMAIAANKVKGIRAALATTVYMGQQSREHDDANVLVLPARVISADEGEEITKAFLNASFTKEERHARRVQKIQDYEQQHIH